MCLYTHINQTHKEYFYNKIYTCTHRHAHARTDARAQALFQ